MKDSRKQVSMEESGGRGQDEGLQETGENGGGGKVKDSRKQVRMGGREGEGTR